jgi:amidase
MAPSFDSAGWFASGPGLFRRIGEVLLDPSGRGTAAIRELIILEDAFAEADGEVVELLQSALADMEAALPKARSERAAPDGLDAWRECLRIIQAGETWHSYGEFIERHKPRLGPGIRERMAFAAQVSERAVADAREMHESARARIHALAAVGTLLALPSAPCVAPLLDTPPDVLEAFRSRVGRITCIAGLGGLPQVSLPAGTIAGAPIGLSFIGWAGGDEALLELAVRLSRYLGRAG